MESKRNARMSTRVAAIATVVMVLALAVGCGQVEPTARSVPPPATTAPPTATSVPPDTPPPTPTPVPTTAPSATATVPPTETPAPTITPSPEPTAEPYQVIRDVPYVPDGDSAQTLTIYLPEAEYQTTPPLFVLGGEWMPDLVRYFVTLGHPVLSISMRDDSYRAEIQDCFCTLAWAHANAHEYGFDPASLVPVGVSMFGGNAALLGAVEDATPFLEGCPHSLPETGRVQGIVALAGVFDYSEEADFFDGFIVSISDFMGGTPDEIPEVWAEASAITWIDGSEPPFLLLHGTADVNVDLHQSELFQAALEEAGVEVELVLIRGTDHQGIIADDRVFEAMQAFLEQLAAPSLAVEPEPAAVEVTFVDSGQTLGSARSWDVALGDLDGDGDLDAFVANDTSDEGNAIWLNEGDGTFVLSEQHLGYGQSVALGDLDGDGDLDAFLSRWWPEEPGTVWLNSGGLQGGTPGIFTDTGQELGSAGGFDVALGDLDGDGDLDAYVAHLTANTVWFNDGAGTLSDTGQRLGEAITAAVVLADLDGDGDLDALAGGWEEPSIVWLNDGTGVFSAHDQTLSSADVHIHGLALGDFDGDGDLDAFLAIASGHPHQVWLNDGSGTFSDSGQVLRAPLAHGVALGDLDGDGDLDALTSHGDRQGGSGVRVWLNDGSGQFAESDVRLGDDYSLQAALADLDGDGDLDAFVTHGESWRESGGGLANKVWFNRTPTTATPDHLLIEAPLGTPPTLDGTLSPDEWSGARTIELVDGSELLLMHDGDYLYLGIRASVHGLGSICLDRGDEVAVLHSSAALGTAVYEKGDAGWQRTRDFSWTCRDTTMTQGALEERARHLQGEGWVASNALMGSGTQMEYQIQMSGGSLRLAVTYFEVSGTRKLIWWPAGLDDDCRKIELVQGYTPTPLQFSPQTWLTIVAVTAP